VSIRFRSQFAVRRSRGPRGWMEIMHALVSNFRIVTSGRMPFVTLPRERQSGALVLVAPAGAELSAPPTFHFPYSCSLFRYDWRSAIELFPLDVASR
jgi:hypothetical protein